MHPSSSPSLAGIVLIVKVDNTILLLLLVSDTDVIALSRSIVSFKGKPFTNQVSTSPFPLQLSTTDEEGGAGTFRAAIYGTISTC